MAISMATRLNLVLGYDLSSTVTAKYVQCSSMFAVTHVIKIIPLGVISEQDSNAE